MNVLQHPEAEEYDPSIHSDQRLRIPQSFLGGVNYYQPVLMDGKGTPDGIGGNSDYYARKTRATQ